MCGLYEDLIQAAEVTRALGPIVSVGLKSRSENAEITPTGNWGMGTQTLGELFSV